MYEIFNLGFNVYKVIKNNFFKMGYLIEEKRYVIFGIIKKYYQEMKRQGIVEIAEKIVLRKFIDKLEKSIEGMELGYYIRCYYYLREK